MHRILYFLVQHSLFPLTRLLFFGNRSGIENLPRAGAYIVAANHSSYIDHFLLAALIQKYRKRKIYFLTRAEAFEGYWSRTWHVATNCVPVDRERPEVGAFRTMAALLKAGEIVVIYPEGTRSESGALLPPKPGAIKLAIHCDVPIVPIGLIGANRILPKRKIVPRWHRAQLHIGAPLRPQDTLRNGKSKEEVALAARDLMGAIAQLCRSPAATVIPAQGAHTVGEGTT